MIKVESISKHYGCVRALDDVSFSIPAGQVVGFLGPNGAGKTTMMKILTCYLDPTSGVASVAGHNCATEPLAARENLGYLPENTPLYRDMVVVDYLGFVAEARGFSGSEKQSRIDKMIEVTGLKGREGYIISELSKGLCQRVGLAQAMLHDPKILILDEPTTGLDPNQIVEIRNLIKEIGQQRTVILSTHILSEVEATCDRVMIIDRGKICKDSLIADFRESAGHYRLGVIGKADEVHKAFDEKPWVKSVNVSEKMKPLEVDLHLKDPGEHGEEIFDTAVKAGLKLVELVKVSESLEDVFRRVTGANPD